MKKFAFCDPETGEIKSVVTPADDNAYEIGVEYNGLVAHEIEFNTNNAEAIQTLYRENDAWATKTTQPSLFHVWRGRELGWVLDADQFWNSIRQKRNQFLAFTDWTQVPDSPLSEADKEAWRVHRQELRDIVSNNPSATSDSDIAWPAVPGQE
jgi:hypothetical protein